MLRCLYRSAAQPKQIKCNKNKNTIFVSMFYYIFIRVRADKGASDVCLRSMDKNKRDISPYAIFIYNKNIKEESNRESIIFPNVLSDSRANSCAPSNCDVGSLPPPSSPRTVPPKACSGTGSDMHMLHQTHTSLQEGM